MHTRVKQPKFNLRGFVNIIKIPKATVILDYYSILESCTRHLQRKTLLLVILDYYSFYKRWFLKFVKSENDFSSKRWFPYDRKRSQRELFPYKGRWSQTIAEPTVAIHFFHRKCQMYKRVVLAGKSKQTSINEHLGFVAYKRWFVGQN